jgi:hypothetical protein
MTRRAWNKVAKFTAAENFELNKFTLGRRVVLKIDFHSSRSLHQYSNTFEAEKLGLLKRTLQLRGLV